MNRVQIMKQHTTLVCQCQNGVWLVRWLIVSQARPFPFRSAHKSDRYCRTEGLVPFRLLQFCKLKIIMCHFTYSTKNSLSTKKSLVEQVKWHNLIFSRQNCTKLNRKSLARKTSSMTLSQSSHKFIVWSTRLDWKSGKTPPTYQFQLPPTTRGERYHITPCALLKSCITSHSCCWN